MTAEKSEAYIYRREIWAGDSRDGQFTSGEGYHYFKMTSDGKIVEAYEYYETDDGQEIVSKVPEMIGTHWIHDLGFEDFETLENVSETAFEAIVEMLNQPSS